MAQDELETLIDWLRRTMPTLLQSSEPWQVVLHGGRGGDVIAEVIRKQSVLAPRKTAEKERLQNGRTSSSHLR